jgi:DNA-binding CsgD family transcriptional regulator
LPDDPHDQLVDRIYEASVVPELWIGVLDSLGAVAECAGTTFLAVDPGQNVRWITSESQLPLATEVERGGWMQRNSRAFRLAPRRYPGFVTDLDLFTREEMDRDPFYTECLRRFGGGWGTGTLIPVPSGDTLIFSIERAFELGPVPRAAVTRLDRLRPHLARAALISNRLRLERIRGMVNALERVGLPAAVLRGDGRVLALNGPLQSLNQQFVIGARDRLALKNAATNQLLVQALETLGASQEGSVRSFPVPADDQNAASIAHLLPIKGAGNDVFTGALGILLVTPLTAPQAPPEDVLNGLFDLTPAEARVAHAIIGGKTVNEVADEFEHSLGTVRQQLKAVLAKTGVRRQAELVGLFAISGLPMRSTGPVPGKSK